MIEVTAEMVQLVYEQIDFVNHGDDGIREGLAAVFAIVERDYIDTDGVHRYGRICPPGNRCVYCVCGAPGPDGLRCARRPVHGDNHAASDGNGLVQW